MAHFFVALHSFPQALAFGEEVVRPCECSSRDPRITTRTQLTTQ